jgi:hypothetical protein
MHFESKNVSQGWPVFFAGEPNFKIIFHLGRHLLKLVTTVKQDFFLSFLVQLRRNIYVPRNCGNQAFPEFLELPRPLGKTQVFLGMPRQLRKFEFNYRNNIQTLGNSKTLKKTKLNQPDFT